MRLVIVSGLSGSGKSVALDAMEDMGFYCIDNVPAALLGGLIKQTIEARDDLYENIAVGVDARNRAADLQTLPDQLRAMKEENVRCEIVFLHADNHALLNRYRETRRRHPLRADDMSLRDAIDEERKLLAPVIQLADFVIDTTASSIYELRDLLRERLQRDQESPLAIQLESFGFKRGLPYDADFVFDVRCLPNPYWDPELRPLNGKDSEVIEFLESHSITQSMRADIVNFLRKRVPEYCASNRNYLTVAIGCTGGQHRSVYLAESIAAELSREFKSVIVRHNGLPRPPYMQE